MSKSQTLPEIEPKQSAAGIAVDPQTLERVIPASQRSDGSVRKERKIRPGFTPQEDIRRFRGTKQVQMDSNALPKGHIIGWSPPPAKDADPSKPMSKSAKKNAKRREKKGGEKKADEPVKDNWEDDDEEPAAAAVPTEKSEPISDETLASKMEKLDVH